MYCNNNYKNSETTMRMKIIFPALLFHRHFEYPYRLRDKKMELSIEARKSPGNPSRSGVPNW